MAAAAARSAGCSRRGRRIGQTTTAQGDYARTADGLANSQRTAKAEMANLSAEMGTMLVPIMKELVTTGRNVISFFTDLSPETQKLILVGAGIVAALGPVVGIFGTLITVGGALAAVVTLYLYGTTFSTASAVFDDVQIWET